MKKRMMMVLGLKIVEMKEEEGEWFNSLNVYTRRNNVVVERLEVKDKKESRFGVSRAESSWRESRKTDCASDADENGSQDPSSELIRRTV